MKVYFEETGGGEGKVWIDVFVNPNGKGYAYHFGSTGKKYLYCWVNSKKARCYDSKDLPKELWQSIRYGTNKVEVDNSKKGYKWNIDDLEYNVVNMKEIRAYKNVLKKLPSVKTLEDFKAIWPEIKKGNRADSSIRQTLFRLVNTSETQVVNGEIGIASIISHYRFLALAKSLGLE